MKQTSSLSPLIHILYILYLHNRQTVYTLSPVIFPKKDSIPWSGNNLWRDKMSECVTVSKRNKLQKQPS